MRWRHPFIRWSPFPALVDELLFRLDLQFSLAQKVARLREAYALSIGYRHADEDEIEAIRNPQHNAMPASYTPHTNEHGWALEVDDDPAGDASVIHLVEGTRYRYYANNFLFWGKDLDRMMEIHTDNLEGADAP